MMKKILSVFLVLVLSLGALVLNTKDANAQPTAYMIADVDIDGTDMTQGDILYVERGNTINVRIEVGTDPENWPYSVDAQGNRIYDTTYVEDDVRIKAEIAGYEYDEIEDVSEMFDVAYNVKYVKYLRLTIPDDIDSSEDYTLKLRAYNQNSEAETKEYTLRIESQRHLLSIMDVIFTPGNLNLNADQPLITSVRLENTGQKKQESIKITVFIPQLGKTESTYIEELVPTENTNDDDEETSESSDAIFFDLRGAQPGTYDLIVRVDYNRGHSQLTKQYQLTINGVSTQGAQANLIVDSAEKTKSVEAGEGIVYKIDLANLGVNARSFTAEVSGLDWGSYRVDPSISVVQPGSTSEMFVYVSPNADVIGQKTLTVNIKEGNNVVKQIIFQANVAEAQGEWDNVLTGLEIGFVVLLIILVILGIILAATKMGKKNNEEPLGE